MIAIVLVGGKHSFLVPLNGEPFLYWVVQWLKTQGFTHIVFSARHNGEKIEAWVNQLAFLEPNLCLDVVIESRPLGTAGAAAFCAKRYPSKFTFIVNGNSIFLTSLKPVIDQLEQDESLDGIIMGTSITNAGRFGNLEVDSHSRLIAFHEKHPGKGPINAGIYLLRNDLLESVISGKELSLEYDCFPLWLREDMYFQVVLDDAPFIEIGTQETLKQAEKKIIQYQSWILGQKEYLIA